MFAVTTAKPSQKKKRPDPAQPDRGTSTRSPNAYRQTAVAISEKRASEMLRITNSPTSFLNALPRERVINPLSSPPHPTLNSCGNGFVRISASAPMHVWGILTPNPSPGRSCLARRGANRMAPLSALRFQAKVFRRGAGVRFPSRRLQRLVYEVLDHGSRTRSHRAPDLMTSRVDGERGNAAHIRTGAKRR